MESIGQQRIKQLRNVKMENEVLTERDCVITDIKVSVGQNVMGGNELICVK